MSIAEATGAPLDDPSEGSTPPGETSRDLATMQRSLLVALAEPGVDLVLARSNFAASRRRRTVTRRILGASTMALLLIVGGLIVLVSGGADPDAILADGDDRSSTTSTVSTSTTVAVEVPVVGAAAPSTSAAPVIVATTVPTATPVDTTPPTTTLTNQAMTARLDALTPIVAAGSVASLRVDWSDSDLGLGSSGPRYIVSWDDPLLSSAIDTTIATPCTSPGAPASGSDTLRFRYSTPGVYRPSVVVETCDGQGAYSERIELTATVTVEAPLLVDPAAPTGAGVPGRAVVVFQPSTAQGITWAPLDRATAEYLPATAPGTPLLVGAPAGPTDPPVAIFTTSGPATVLVVPANASGVIRLRWSDPVVCASTTGPELLGNAGTALSLPLAIASC